MGSLLEMMFVLLGAAILTVQGIKQDVAHKRDTMLAVEGQNEATLVTAYDSWITDNFASLLSQYTASGNNATLTPPTVDQLKTAGNLKQAHSMGPFWGGGYAVSMTMVPAGCTQAAGNCHVSFALYPTQPLLKGGKADVAGAAQIAVAGSKLAGTSQFGYSNAQAPGTITGINGSFTAPNPLGSKAASIMATNGPDSDGNSIYIRRDGSVTWTGDQDVNNVSLKNVNDIKAQTIEASGAVTAASVTATGAVKGNAVTSTTTLQAGNIASPRSPCSPNGVIANNSDGSGQQLTCQSGIWLPNGGRVLRMGYNPVSDGGIVWKPSCPAGGTPIVELTPQNWYVNQSATVNFNAYDNGTYWIVRITDGANAGITGLAYAGTYCSY
ncbi:hypothetical protein H3V53_15215 [Paraburkholderia bengalensis]|uniref:Shufflon protein, N-terminal constant region n=1 Tax=Paraburkholderia bengalensis TaxID=2747562 RepID=A0ABU8ISD5_9BURK